MPCERGAAHRCPIATRHPRIVALGIVTVALAGCTADTTRPPESGPAVSVAAFSRHGISFSYPAGWKRAGPFGSQGATWQVAFGPPSGEGFVEVVAFDLDTAPRTSQLRAFASNFFAFVQNEASGDQPRGQVAPAFIGGVEALHIRFTGPGLDKLAMAFTHGTTLYGLDRSMPVPGDATQGCETAIRSWRFEGDDDVEQA